MTGSITVEQIGGYFKDAKGRTAHETPYEVRYKVLQAVNIIDPELGDILIKDDIESLIKQGIEVVIPSKGQDVNETAK